MKLVKFYNWLAEWLIKRMRMELLYRCSMQGDCLCGHCSKKDCDREVRGIAQKVDELEAVYDKLNIR